MSIDNINMENKLRQLESQSLPDLSQQDKHWQEMKNLLTPAAAPASSGITNARKWFIAACITAAVVLFVFILAKRQTADEKPLVNKKTVIQKEAATITEKIQPVNDTTALPALIQNNTPGLNNDIKAAPKEPVYAISATAKKCNCKNDWLTDSIKMDTATADISTTEDKGTTLAAFFAQLEKPTQEFVIDSRRDTVIFGNEGSALLIPAGSFTGNESITIEMKEYYSNEDIITNKLSTTSDDNPLITGGMLHLQAYSNGKPVVLRPSASIRWFIPDTSADMKEMQVFNGEGFPGLRKGFIVDDNTGTNKTLVIGEYNSINWVPEERMFTENYFYTSVRVLDMRDEPYQSKDRKKGRIGKFHIAADSKISKEQMEKDLMDKYGYYKVKIKVPKDRRGFMSRIFPGLFRLSRIRWSSLESLGDSTWMDAQVAARYKLKATDTMVSNRTGTGSRIFTFTGSNSGRGTGLQRFDTTLYSNNANPAFTKENLAALSKKYSVDITKLGWINCDKFYKDNRPKVPLYVDIKDTAKNYYTLLVFDKIKSMMSGIVSGNKVVFSNIPEGAKAKVISIGIRKGKSVAAVQKVTISKDVVSDLRFEETTPEAFKEKAATLNK